MDELERAYTIAAEIVQKFGDTYLPLFERLHMEMQKRQTSLELRSIALGVANKGKEKPS